MILLWLTIHSSALKMVPFELGPHFVYDLIAFETFFVLSKPTNKMGIDSENPKLNCAVNKLNSKMRFFD